MNEKRGGSSRMSWRDGWEKTETGGWEGGKNVEEGNGGHVVW
jgi:hypothetical protein